MFNSFKKILRHLSITHADLPSDENNLLPSFMRDDSNSLTDTIKTMLFMQIMVWLLNEAYKELPLSNIGANEEINNLINDIANYNDAIFNTFIERQQRSHERPTYKNTLRKQNIRAQINNLQMIISYINFAPADKYENINDTMISFIKFLDRILLPLSNSKNLKLSLNSWLDFKQNPLQLLPKMYPNLRAQASDSLILQVKNLLKESLEEVRRVHAEQTAEQSKSNLRNQYK